MSHNITKLLVATVAAASVATSPVAASQVAERAPGAGVAASTTHLAAIGHAATRGSAVHKRHRTRCPKGKKRVGRHCRPLTQRKPASAPPAVPPAAADKPVPQAPASAPSGDAPKVQAAVQGSPWTDLGIISTPLDNTTSCFSSPTASGDGVTNNANGGYVVANFPNVGGLYVQPWLYIYHGRTQTDEWVPMAGGSRWIGPLVQRDYQAPAATTDWTISPGQDAYIKVLWQIADPSVMTMAAGWAPSYREGGFTGYTDWCYYP